MDIVLQENAIKPSRKTQILSFYSGHFFFYLKYFLLNLLFLQNLSLILFCSQSKKSVHEAMVLTCS